MNKIYSGYGSIEKVKDILGKEKPKKIFVVTGKASFELSGAKKALEPLLQPYTTISYSDFETNVKLNDLKQGVKLYQQENPDLIIGIGGGSVMDMAKAIALLANEQNPDLIVKGEQEPKPRTIKTIMIPTTAGTGSESNRFCVIYIGKTKNSLRHPSSLPDYTILDPTFTESLPPEITAHTGLDALAQALESYWAVSSTEESRTLSKKAIEIILPNLEKTVNNPDKPSRENMLRGANIAGQAIHIASTTASHAFSYPMTAHFNVPHGHAVGLTLSYVFEFNANVTEETCQDPRGQAFVRERMQELVTLLKTTSVEEAKNKLIDIMKSIHLKTTLSELNINDEGRQIILKEGFNPERIKNNPGKISEEAFKKILDQIQ